MVVIRNVFQLKFGKAREAVAIVKEGIAIQQRLSASAGIDVRHRVLTDITGPFYTLVLELTVPGIAAFEQSAGTIMGHAEWQANYQKLVPLVESGYREILTVVSE